MQHIHNDGYFLSPLSNTTETARYRRLERSPDSKISIRCLGRYMTTAAVSKLAIISGIAFPGGIGRNLCHAFLKAGYLVGGIDIISWDNSGDCDEILAVAQAENKFAFAQADISDVNAVAAAAENILSHVNCSRVHTLVNNAGISIPTMPETDNIAARVSTWRRFVDVNLSGAYILTQVMMPHMSEQSSIIHISSTRAYQSEPNCEGYAAAKAGLCGLTHAQAISFANRGIRVNAVLPGWIDTGGYPISAEDREWHPAGRVGVPADISSLCLFLSDSAQSGFITGQEFIIDGGVSKKMVYPEVDEV